MRAQVKLSPDHPRETVSLDWAAGFLGIHNLTPYPIYVNYSANGPDSNIYDLIIPAATVMNAPLPGSQSFSFFMDTSGVVVTFDSPPAVLTLDTDPINYGFSQVHLTYPYSSNLQFLARTQQADQYALFTVGIGATATPLVLTIPDGELYVIRRVMVRAIDAGATNQAYIRVRAIRGVSAFYPPIVYRYFSTADNQVWTDVDGLNIVCAHVYSGGDIDITARNYSGSATITMEARIQIDVVKASLP